MPSTWEKTEGPKLGGGETGQGWGPCEGGAQGLASTPRPAWNSCISRSLAHGLLLILQNFESGHPRDLSHPLTWARQACPHSLRTQGRRRGARG